MPDASLTDSQSQNRNIFDPGDEPLSPVAQLMEELCGKRPHYSSIGRIVTRGTRRAGKLPALQVLGCWQTTRKALLEWLQRGTAAALNQSVSNGGTDEEQRTAGLPDSPSGPVVRPPSNPCN